MNEVRSKTILSAQKNRLDEQQQDMFWMRPKKIVFNYAPLSGDPSIYFALEIKFIKFKDLQLKTPFSLENLVYLKLFYKHLTLKAPITTAADDKFCNIFPSFRQK